MIASSLSGLDMCSLLGKTGQSDCGPFLSLVLDRGIVLITGASAGIGAATAKLFAQTGVSVLILTARRTVRLAEVKRECEAVGKVKVVTVEADMTKRSDIERILPGAGDVKIDM